MFVSRVRTRAFGAVTSLFLLLASGAPGQEPIVFSGHSGAVMMAAFAGDDQRVVTASSDQTARLWDAKTGMVLSSFAQHTGPLYCLAVSADGRTLVTGSQDNTLRVWDLPLRKAVRSLTEVGPVVHDIALGPDGKSLVTASADRSVRLLDLSQSTGVPPAIVPALIRIGHSAEPTATAFRNDGVCFASADTTGVIRLWSPDLEPELSRLQGHSGKVNSILFPGNNQQLVAAGDDGVLRIWQLMPRLPQLVRTFEDAVFSLEVVPGQPLGLCSVRSGVCRLMNLQTAEIVREFPRSESVLSNVALAPNSSWYLHSTADGRSRVTNFNDGSLMGTVGGHDGPISDAVVHPDSQRFLTAGIDGTARFWKQPVPAVPMAGHAATIRGMTGAANGQWIATISDDMTARVWNGTGGALLSFANHTQPLRAIASRDDDALIASGDAAGTVWIWNPGNGAAEGVVEAHSAPVTALMFSADRMSLLTAGTDGLIRSWALPLPAQKPAAGEEPRKPVWEIRSSDGSAIVQLARLSQERGFIALTANGGQLQQLQWDGSAVRNIASPGGLLRTLDAASTGTTFVATSDSGQLHVFGNEGQIQKSLAVPDITAARLDREGKLALACDAQSRIRVISIETGTLQEEILTTLPVTEAEWGLQEQTSLIGIGASNEPVVAQRSLLRIWEELPDGVTAVAISPDQQFILCGASDGKIRQWQISDGAAVRILEGPSGAISELTVSPNGQFVCSSTEGGSLCIWTLSDGALKHRLEEPQPLRSISISSDSTRIATACIDGTVRVRDIATGRILESFAEHTAGTPVNAVRYLNDSQTLVSAGDDKSVRRLQSSVTASWPIHAGAIRSMTGYNGGAQVITAGEDGRVVMTSVSNGNADRLYSTGELRPVVVAARSDNQRVAAGCETGQVLIWNAGDGATALQTLNVGASVKSLAWSPDNRKLVVSAADNSVQVFGPSIQGQQPQVELVLHQHFHTDAGITRALFAPSNQSILLSLDNGRIEEWAYAGIEQRRQMNHGGPVYDAAVSRDGLSIISASADQTLRVWDAATGQQRFQLNGHQGAVHAVAMSPDETFAVSAGADGSLRLWDIVGGRQLKQLITYSSTMYSVAVHPHGAIIAAAGADRKVHLMDMISGNEIRTLEGHTDYIHSVAFSPAGDQLLSYGYAGQLRLWNVADGRLLHETRIGRVGNSARFAADGRHLVIANGDGTARIAALP